MYNLHQYNETVKMAQRERESQERYSRYILKHEDFKEKAVQKQKEKVKSFIQQQNSKEKPFIFEDDHFKRWRPLKQFRDVQDGTKFLSHKTFRHKPHYEMDKYYNERQRKEIMELSFRKEHLVKSSIIPPQQRSRSLRCQGPLNPKIQFRQRKSDHEYMQPRMRYTNITDRERFNETSMTFDDKLHSIYKSFELTKSKLGRTTISPKKQEYKNKDTLDQLEDCSSEMAKSKNYYYEKEESKITSPLSPSLAAESKCNPQVFQDNNKKTKTYFKLAKTTQLFSKDRNHAQQIDNFLKLTQFQRKKDLTNIQNNLSHQNYFKRPIL